MRVRSAAAVVVAEVLVAAGATSQAGAEILSDSWYESTLGAMRVGHAHRTVEVRDDETVVTEAASHMEVRRLGDLVRIEMAERWEETESGVPVVYRSTMGMSNESTEITAAVDGATLRLTKSIGEDSIVRDVDIGSGLLFPHAVTALHVDRGFEAGSEYEYFSFDTEFEDVGRCRVRVEGDEEIEILGEVRKLHRLVVALDLYGGMEVLEWRDDQGLIWREEVPALGLVQELTTRETALREAEAGDIVTSTFVPSNVEFRHPRRVESALYELWLERGDIADRVVEDARQRIEERTELGVLLRVASVAPEPGTTVPFPIEGGGMAEYLEANPVLSADSPGVAAAALAAVGKEGGDSWDASREIGAWVYRAIAGKGMGTAFASAREVLETREGDCSEHAVLMAAMTRSVGIPSRVVAGLVYSDGIFGYHMWTEVWTGDGWHALDPTMGGGAIDATHIKLTASSLAGGVVGELAFGIVGVVNQLGIRVIEYSVGGETFRAASVQSAP